MDDRPLRELLLEMACTERPVDPAHLSGVDETGWAQLARMAAQHRLEPLLHTRLAGRGEVPAALRESWRAVHRFSTFSAMVQRQELADVVRLLADNGCVPVALKGAFLAWHAYPEPALRPLRDLDLLVDGDRVVDAFVLLCASGYRTADDGPANLSALQTKHLPPLIAPRGTVIELHRRLWESDGELDHGLPESDEAALRARAIAIDDIFYPAAEDMLAHLVVHATYSHRLDCGPLLLWDLRHLVASQPIDWERVWDAARRQRWDRGAALVVGLMRRHFGAGAVPQTPAEPEPAPDELLDAAPELLLQDLDTRRSAGVVATALAAGPQAFVARVSGGRIGSRAASTQADGGSFASWAGPRLQRTLADVSRKSVRRQARNLSRLSRWLNG